MTPREWYPSTAVAEMLHVTRRHLQRLLAPHRDRCHLAREGRHPRLVLWIPAPVVRTLREERRATWRRRLGGGPGETPVKPFSPRTLT